MSVVCPVCDRKPVFTWTDSHGIAQCMCGTPFTIYHYENNKRIDKPPECLVKDDWIPRLRRFREETGRTIPSGCSLHGGQELATGDDIRAWNKFVEQCEEVKP